jgi:branched-chain amino acid transport system substrate-binding protein
MAANNVKTIGYIGYADPYGQLWLKAIQSAAEAKGIKITATESYQRNDTSVTGQALKLIAAKPDAVLIAGSGTPAVLPQSTLIERGYKGKFYQTHGIANRDFLRVGGKNVEGTIFPVGPMLLAEQLADSHPSKKPAMEYIKRYEGAHGANSRSTFGGHGWDAYLLLDRAVPEALKKAKPGTPEFRVALREALENVRELPAVHGVFNMSANDHNGFDARAAIMATVENGDWKLLK